MRHQIVKVVLADKADLRPTDFEAFYCSRYSGAVRTCALVTGVTSVAEELAQEVFLDMFRRWDSIETPDAWLRVAVVHRCRSWQRRHILERLKAPQTNLVTTDPDGLAVRVALSALNPRQRLAVVLRYFDDMSEADIAAALRCRPGTVKSLLARSMPILREVLRD